MVSWLGFKFVQMKGYTFFQGEIITKQWKYIEKIYKNHLANFNQTGHKASFGEGNFTNKDHSVFKNEVVAEWVFS